MKKRPSRAILRRRPAADGRIHIERQALHQPQQVDQVGLAGCVRPDQHVERSQLKRGRVKPEREEPPRGDALYGRRGWCGHRYVPPSPSSVAPLNAPPAGPPPLSSHNLARTASLATGLVRTSSGIAFPPSESGGVPRSGYLPMFGRSAPSWAGGPPTNRARASNRHRRTRISGCRRSAGPPAAGAVVSEVDGHRRGRVGRSEMRAGHKRSQELPPQARGERRRRGAERGGRRTPQTCGEQSCSMPEGRPAEPGTHAGEICNFCRKSAKS